MKIKKKLKMKKKKKKKKMMKENGLKLQKINLGKIILKKKKELNQNMMNFQISFK